MSRRQTSDEVIELLLQEVQQVEPDNEDADRRALRLRVRREVERIRERGRIVDIPFEIPDPPDPETD